MIVLVRTHEGTLYRIDIQAKKWKRLDYQGVLNKGFNPTASLTEGTLPASPLLKVGNPMTMAYIDSGETIREFWQEERP